MRFRIYRTSDHSNCPCREAEFNREANEYNIEVNTLDELIGLSKKYGDIIIFHENFHGQEKGIPAIEIYDDARE